MADLSTQKRKSLTKSQFGLPSKVDKGKEKENQAGRGAYPMPDRRHAANAKARATQEYNKGKLSKSQEEQIKAKANKVLSRDDLSRGTSKEAREKNIKTEIAHGKPPKQAVAIGYAKQRENIAKKAHSKDAGEIRRLVSGLCDAISRLK